MAPIHMFLSPSGGPVGSVYRAALRYGPYEAEGQPAFSRGWEIEIDPAQEDSAWAFAVSDGVVRVVADSIATGRVSIILGPLVVTLRQLRLALVGVSEIPIGFLYTGMDAATLPIHFENRILAAPNPENLTLDERLDRFMTGEDTIDVRAGDLLGRVGVAPDSSWHRIGFEILMPGGNRLDPLIFFSTLRDYGGPGAPFLAPVTAENDLLSLISPRFLLDLRSAQNFPYEEDVFIVTEGNPQLVSVPAEHRGHVELAIGQRHTVVMSGKRFTESPVGDVATEGVSRVATAPFQWVVQALDPNDWFAAPTPPYPPEFKIEKFTEGNRVTALIDGIETFRSMFREGRRINDATHFFYLAAWCLQMDFPFVPGNISSSLTELTKLVDSKGARIRALIWKMLDLSPAVENLPNVALGCPNHAAADFINGLTNGKAIRDDRTVEVELPLEYRAALWTLDPVWAARLSMVFGRRQPVGAHHQKILAINNSDGLVAFCGGIDPNAERLQEPGHAKSQHDYWSGVDDKKPYHDAHCKVEGPAAVDLLNTFRHRWISHPQQPPGDDLPDMGSVRPTTAKHFVQIGRTYPRSLHYPFAPDGDRTIFETLKRAVRRARRYIYIEDQYLTSEEMSDVLEEVVERLAHLIIVVPIEGWELYPYRDAMRKAFIQSLKAKAPGVVRAFSLRARSRPTYVHSKILIVDDVFASIGSANINRRGHTGDGEANVMVVDGAVQQGGRKFARDLRIRLWGEHLGLSRFPELLDDAVEAGRLWDAPTALASIVPYDESLAGEPPGPQVREYLYDPLVDPDGNG